jgi:polyhydroxybutyrate depolymerase
VPTIQVGGARRTYLHVAPRTPHADAPLLLALHGTTQTGATMRRFSGRTFDALADTLGADLVYLDGYRRAWNDGRRIRTSATQRRNTDDLGFLDTVIARFGRPTIAIGYSNGGQLLHRFARESTTPLAGRVLIAAGLPVSGDREYPDAVIQSAPTLLIQGTADPVMPVDGGTVRVLGRSKGSVVSARETAATYAGPEAPTTRHDDGVERIEWPGVRLVLVPGAGHVIPNRVTSPPFVGPSPKLLDLGDEIRDAFGLATGGA